MDEVEEDPAASSLSLSHLLADCIGLSSSGTNNGIFVVLLVQGGVVGALTFTISIVMIGSLIGLGVLLCNGDSALETTCTRSSAMQKSTSVSHNVEAGDSA